MARMGDDRQHARQPIALRVAYQRLNGFFADYTRNISKGGTFIRTDHPLPVGTRFAFTLDVPSRPEPFLLDGLVVHSGSVGGEVGMGIAFVWTEDAVRSAFEAEVERLMTESLGAEVVSALLSPLAREEGA